MQSESIINLLMLVSLPMLFAYFLACVVIACLAGTIATSKNRSRPLWEFGTLLVALLFSPFMGFAMMLACGLTEKLPLKPRRVYTMPKPYRHFVAKPAHIAPSIA